MPLNEADRPGTDTLNDGDILEPANVPVSDAEFPLNEPPAAVPEYEADPAEPLTEPPATDPEYEDDPAEPEIALGPADTEASKVCAVPPNRTAPSVSV